VRDDDNNAAHWVFVEISKDQQLIILRDAYGSDVLDVESLYKGSKELFEKILKESIG